MRIRTDSPRSPSPPDDVVVRWMIPFLLLHLGCLAAVFTGVGPGSLALCFLLYVVRGIAVTAGYHRYFSHRAFKTSRAFQFVLAALAETTGQQGVLWWAAKHRAHHRDADTPNDAHSPVVHGLWFAHFGWIYSRAHHQADYGLVRDLQQFPELVWLDRHYWVPLALLGGSILLFGGAQAFVVGFLWSTVAIYHGTFAINSLGHTIGRRRFDTPDSSRNSLCLALLFFGEGWHNNHHHAPARCRQGLKAWEWDPTFWVLRALEFLGIVYELRGGPGRDHNGAAAPDLVKTS